MGTAELSAEWARKVVDFENSLTVVEKAKRYGVSVSTIRRWKAGQTSPVTKSLFKVVSAWPARIQFEYYSYLFAGPWKKTATEVPAMCNQILEILRKRADREEISA